MKKIEVAQAILGKKLEAPPIVSQAKAFAPTNIALCKYWGKRNQEINLPVTSSLSVSLGNKGATVEIKLQEATQDSITLNNQAVSPESSFSTRLVEFLDIFRSNLKQKPVFCVNILSNIPIAAGLASSACGFASVVKALDGLYGWNLPPRELSVLARLGSGSASRSILPGFVEWHAGIREDGLDSYADAMNESWPDFCVGLLIMNASEKSISSREAMQRTVTTSALYSAWPAKVSQDLLVLKHAINNKDFDLLGKTAESNALTMHATMLSAWPPVTYALPETVLAMQKIWQLRSEGLAVYFTQDAGPNLKLLFLKKEIPTVTAHFPTLEIVRPFTEKL